MPVRRLAIDKLRPIERHYSREAPFVDRVKCLLSSGAGGDGVVMFHHMMNKEFGGPSGASGGKGGSVFAACTRQYPDLAHLAALGANVKAHSGTNGGIENRGGRTGTDLTLSLPPGTVITDVDTNTVVLDLDEPGTTSLLLEGGKGGKGNAAFQNAVNHAPTEATKGLPGNTMLTQFELKMIADVGLVGFPNAGKSSILAAISTAKPKVAPFPFATLHPTIGKLQDVRGNTCEVADLPGLIEGAYENRGLGHQFLRHVERTQGIAFVIDMVEAYVPPDRDTPQTPWEVLETLKEELDFFLPGLSDRGMMVLANKMDATHDWQGNRTADVFVELQRRAGGLPCFPVSAALGEAEGPLSKRSGLKDAVDYMCGEVFAHKAAVREDRARQKDADAEELLRMFRDENPQYFSHTTTTSIAATHNVHYVTAARLHEDKRYDAPSGSVASGGGMSRTEAMLERRRDRSAAGVAPAAASSSSSSDAGARRSRGPKSIWASEETGAAAMGRRRAVPSRLGRRPDSAESASLEEALAEAGTRGRSLVDQQLESHEGASGHIGHVDPYLNLDDRGRTSSLRDIGTGVLDGLRLGGKRGTSRR